MNHKLWWKQLKDINDRFEVLMTDPLKTFSTWLKRSTTLWFATNIFKLSPLYSHQHQCSPNMSILTNSMDWMSSLDPYWQQNHSLKIFSNQLPALILIFAGFWNFKNFPDVSIWKSAIITIEIIIFAQFFKN